MSAPDHTTSYPQDLAATANEPWATEAIAKYLHGAGPKPAESPPTPITQLAAEASLPRVTLAGEIGEFEFACPAADTSEVAFLQIHFRGSTSYPDQGVLINDTRTLFVDEGTLTEADNTLRIESQVKPLTGNWDNFTIDSVVVSYKTLSCGFGTAEQPSQA